MTPTEMVLAGLAGCLTAGVAAVATNRGVQLRSVRATLEGDMDLAGILGIDSDVRNGFSGIRVALRDRRRRHQGRARGHRRPVAEAVRRLRHHHQPDHRRRRGRLIGDGERRQRVRHDASDTHHRRGRDRRRPGGPGDEPLPDQPCRRPRRPRTRRDGELVADRALGLAPAAHPELAEPAARAGPTGATTRTAS